MDEEKIDFRVEAEGVIKDIAFTVDKIMISTKLPGSRECVYLNIQTKENQKYCVQICIQGFRVVSEQFDHLQDDPQTPFFETIYALLDTISPQYSQMFSKELARKLLELKDLENADDTK